MARLLTGLGVLLLLGSAVWPAGSAEAQPKPAEPKPSSQDCLACHGDKDLKRGAPKPGRRDALFADEAVLKASAHARLECAACHRTAMCSFSPRLVPATAPSVVLKNRLAEFSLLADLGQEVRPEPKNAPDDAGRAVPPRPLQVPHAGR